jgi:hypothetical protein
MNLSEKLHQDKLTLIAMNALTHDLANQFPLSLEGPLSQQCAQAGVNRSQVYEKKSQLQQLLSEVELASPGRPTSPLANEGFPLEEKEWQLKISVLQYRLDHPGAMVIHQHYQTYSPEFKRFILRQADSWQGSMETFCHQIGVPYSSFSTWEKNELLVEACEETPKPRLPRSASEDCHQIVFDYQRWQGSLREFLAFEASRLNLTSEAIRRVLIIAGILKLKSSKSPRYRGSTEKLSPGSMLVTDGKQINLFLSHSQTSDSYNWQAMIDQSTLCHTASVVSKNESAQGVKEAFQISCQFMGRAPLALLHDNKPIHHQKELRDAIEPTTLMIAATPFRPQNKADVEGEFGKWQQWIGTIILDDSNIETLQQSAVSEVIRAYTTAGNHAQRFELDGKSRQRTLKDASPSPDKDRKFLQKLHANHLKKPEPLPLDTQTLSRQILDRTFKDHDLEELDKGGKTRRWIAARFTPKAIRQALALFATERKKGRLQHEMAVRYLVKVIQSQQHELDLREQEQSLLSYAQQQKKQWLFQWENDYQAFEESCSHQSSRQEAFACQLAEMTLFASIFLQRAFWEDKLKTLLKTQQQLLHSVCQHLRRLFEADSNDRFQLISSLIEWDIGLV